MEEKKKIAIVGFSFALVENEPNICNINLAGEIKRIARIKRSQGYEVYIVSQWEISKVLEKTENFKPKFTVYRDDEKYLSSDDVVNKSLSYLKEKNVKDIIIVANPFIHLFVCRRLFKEAGFTVLKEKIKMTEEKITAHMKAMHKPEDPIPTKAEIDGMIEQMTEPIA